MRSPIKTSDHRNGHLESRTGAIGTKVGGRGLSGQQASQMVNTAGAVVSSLAGCYQAAQKTRQTDLECGDRRDARHYEDRRNERYYDDRKAERHDAALAREQAHRETLQALETERAENQRRRDAAAQLQDDLRDGRISLEEAEMHLKIITGI